MIYLTYINTYEDMLAFGVLGQLIWQHEAQRYIVLNCLLNKIHETIKNVNCISSKQFVHVHSDP